MITNLAYFREMNLKSMSTFRNVVLQTDSRINWTDNIELADYDSLESHQDLFDFSFQILNKDSMRKFNRFGINLNLDKVNIDETVLNKMNDWHPTSKKIREIQLKEFSEL